MLDESSSPPAPADVAGGQQPGECARYVDSEEAVHFFNDEMVLSTNDVRSGDADDDLADHAAPAAAPARAACSRPASDSDDEQLEADAEPPRPLRQMTYEDVYPSFDDLYLWDAVPPTSNALQHRHRHQQQRRAARALRAFCRDVCDGHTYVYRKRAEFLRVCHSRALDADRDREQEERAVHAAATNAAATDGERFFEWRRRDGIVDLASAELQPRKWPHLPYRNPREWKDDIRNVLEFARRVLELPPGSLLYEPIDVEGFVLEACDFLEKNGVDARYVTAPMHMCAPS
ncbi:hypothetical protein ATCC90586_002385 [Pythium insidiosum]|nr:hypothetical protein ATCC90586_002385 [Pythium insidiosum]